MNRWSSYIGFSFPSAVDWESRLPCVLGTRKSRLSLFTREQQKLLDKAREMEGIPDLSALLRGKLQMISSSAGTSEVRPTRADGDADSEPPARSPPKERATKSKKQSPEEQPSTLERNVPLEMAPSSADASEVAAKKRRRRKTARRGLARRLLWNQRGPQRLWGVMIWEDLTRSILLGGHLKGVPRRRLGGQPRGMKVDVMGPPFPRALLKAEAALRMDLHRMSGRGFLDRVEFLYDERTPLVLNPLRCAELTRQIRGGTEVLFRRCREEYTDAAVASKRPMIDITSAPPERMVVPEGTPTEERPDGNDLKATGDAIQADTGNVAAEDPVLVSSSEEREEDEVGEEENRSSPALIKETVRDLSASDPPAQVEDLDAQAVEEETAEPLAPSRDDQDIVV
ncbi:hypothetical protein HID58_062963 [Brassica napus]|uniref:Uncharacterized protein n=1 Tax=Brassica napus TaxID=3708 RepID=A0ABQ8A3H3_BRANA|nr:hypothetical protein HID58_062963 [Brassica napus]